jgi:hypothetical protein
MLSSNAMLRVILITLAVLLALRLFARLTAPRAASPRRTHPRERDVGRNAADPAPPTPALSPQERARLEAERELALREGRQIDAIEIHRRLKERD